MTVQADEASEPMILLAVGGDPSLPTRLPERLPAGTIVVAADSGLDRLVDAGLPVHHVVGDLDSASPEAVGRAVEAGATVHRHPADKDATDIELALDLVVAQLVPATGIDRLLVVGAGGGRLDHLVADLLVLAAARLAQLEVTARLGSATASIVHPGPGRSIAGQVGDQVSLLPIHGAAAGVTTVGLRWALLDADLVAGTTRAVSNELAAPDASVAIAAGVLAVIQPGSRAPAVPDRTTPYDPTPRTPRSPR